MVNVAYEWWKMKRQKSVPFQNKKHSYINNISIDSTTSSTGIKSILKKSIPAHKDSLGDSSQPYLTPIAKRESPLNHKNMPGLNNGSVSQFNKCFIKFNAKADNIKGRNLTDHKHKTECEKESEKRLLNYMDKNKIYFNSLRAHMQTSRQNARNYKTQGSSSPFNKSIVLSVFTFSRLQGRVV